MDEYPRRRVVLPEWPPGTVAVLATADGPPHAIPVSTAVRAGDARVLLALSPRRGSLARLRTSARCSLLLLAAGDVAVTAHGRARVVAAPLPGAERVVAVAVDVDRLQQHGTDAFVVEDGVRWTWTDPEAERQDRAVRAALATLADA
jgi:hypothetical protein